MAEGLIDEVWSTYIQVADTCFEGDDGSYRHNGRVSLCKPAIVKDRSVR